MRSFSGSFAGLAFDSRDGLPFLVAPGQLSQNPQLLVQALDNREVSSIYVSIDGVLVAHPQGATADLSIDLASLADGAHSLSFLVAGDLLDSRCGQAEVAAVRTFSAPDSKFFTVYNCEVEQFHSYFVLPPGKDSMDEAIWVHNHDYVINPAHVPPHLRDPKKDPLMAGMSPQDRYNPGKSVLPPNHKEAWDNSVPDPKAPNSTRWSKEGNGKKSVFHKFFGNHQDTWHWVGSTINETLSGKPRIVPQNQIPQSVKNQIGF